jgi:UDP-N-acetylmuramoyl-L-alanyl-D-glutamate--2,6-diaminopimelate ligase
LQSHTSATKSLEELLQGVAYTHLAGPSRVKICEITFDSRTVKPNGLFVAISGSKADGHQFIGAAIERGAVAIVGERTDLSLPSSVAFVTVENSRRALAELASSFYAAPTRDLFTVGITGTNGKTSITFLSQSVLGAAKTAISNTVINALHYGIDYTTPNALDLQRFAHQARVEHRENCVIEVSAHALSQERVHGIDFDVAVFTNLTQDHFDYYSGFELYLKAKRKLFESLGEEARALINADDPYAEHFLKNTRARVWTYGLNSNCDLWADQLALSAEGNRFVAHTPGGNLPICSALPGEFYVYNTLAAIGVGLSKGISLAQIKEGIEKVSFIEGRFERYKTKNGAALVIDFAHSPDSLEKMIKTLKKLYPRVLTVFGCGGESDPYKRPIMGEISGRLSDFTLITSDNPKHEDPEEIVREIEEGIRKTDGPYEAIIDRPIAILRALEIAKPGDCVLIAGKGHERTQVFKGREIAFNDREFLLARGLI